tara:strand:+ start:241 stop:606 length:366 start_codon:yes stop_codon:yes gene_type:complete
MNLLSDPSLISFVSKEAELEKPSVYNGETSIWIEGALPSGIPRTVILELYRCTPESLKVCVVLIEKGMAQYSSLTWDYPTHIQKVHLALLSKLLIEQLLEGQGLPISKYITGGRIGQAEWH